VYEPVLRLKDRFIHCGFQYGFADEASFITGEILDVNGGTRMDGLKKDEQWTVNHER
jgi:hypothetical protein